jgi:branched-chain amino acid transport system substrate-binding protein
VTRHPLGISDFASYILEAQASGANVVAMVSGGSDLTNLIKQAGEFGLASAGQKIVSMQTYISDVHSLGLEKAAGLLLTASFYWDLDDKTRAWSQRFAALDHGRMPTMVQAGVYSAVRHYLKAVAAAGSVDGQKVAATMRSMPVDDFMTENAPIRADGWVMRKMYLFKVKSPAASKGPWDYYDLVSTVDASDAAPPEVNPCK